MKNNKYIFRMFDSMGNRLLIRHHLNMNRTSKVQTRKFANDLLAHGWFAVMRGKMMGVPNSRNPEDGASLLFASSTITDGFYLAHDLDRENPHIQKVSLLKS